MRADADFMVYVAARWPSLVKDAVRLGCPPEQAAEAATEALSRCRRRWGRVSREEDVDQLVQGELAVSVNRRRRTPEGTRQEAAEELLVLAPPTLEDVRHHERVGRRRTLTRAGAVVVPLLLVVAGVTVYYGVIDEDPAPPAPEDEVLARAAASRQDNPAPGVVWYADGQLHLEHSVLAIEGLRDMTRLGSGVVYGDDEGRVVYAADDGSRTLLGHKDPEEPVAATDETGLAAWYDPDTKEVVIVEAATANVRVRTGVDDDPDVVAVDGDVVYVKGDKGTRALLPTGPTSQVPVSPAGLLDARARVRAFQLDPETIQVVPSYFDVEFDLPGRGATLSPDGNIVVTRLPGTDSSIAIYDTRTGEELLDGLGNRDDALAFSLGRDETIAYVVAPNGLAPGRELELRTCDLTIGWCDIVARLPNFGDTPVLAR